MMILVYKIDLKMILFANKLMYIKLYRYILFLNLLIYKSLLYSIIIKNVCHNLAECTEFHRSVVKNSKILVFKSNFFLELLDTTLRPRNS